MGFVYPGDGNDRVYGSHSTASDYMDHLTGENGCDQIYGHKGNDFINVDEMRNAGFHSIDNNGESVYGNQGRDEIVGAANDANATDTIFADGGNGADILCTGRVGDVTGNKVFFFGGNEDDEIYSNSSFVAGFDGPIDGGSGDDGCDNPGEGSETNCNRAFDWTNFTPWPPTCK